MSKNQLFIYLFYAFIKYVYINVRGSICIFSICKLIGSTPTLQFPFIYNSTLKIYVYKCKFGTHNTNISFFSYLCKY